MAFSVPLTILLTSTILSKTINAESAPIRVNCGASVDTVIDGVTWDADRGYFGWFDRAIATTYNSDVNTNLHTFERDAYWPGMYYTFNLDSDASGDYIINLYFSEPSKTNSNQRLFNIVINGETVESNLDIFSETGGKNIELIKSYEISISSNNFEIEIYFERGISSIDRSICSAIEILQASTITQNSWITLESMPYAIGEISAASVDDNGYYVFGGAVPDVYYNEGLLYYDIQTDTWIQKNNVPWFGQGDHQTVQVYDGKIYTFGGSNDVEGHYMRFYDPSTDTWTKLEGLYAEVDESLYGSNVIPWIPISASSAVMNDKIYIAGGVVEDENLSEYTTNRVFEYDIINNAWSEKTSMPNEGRNHAAGIGYNGLFYIFGGRLGGNTPSAGYDTSLIYNPNTDSWSNGSPMLSGTGGNGHAVQINGKLIITGGEDCCATLGLTHSYDPITDTWEYLSPMLTPRHGISPVVIGQRIYVAGGGPSSGFYQSDIQEALVFQ